MIKLRNKPSKRYDIAIGGIFAIQDFYIINALSRRPRLLMGIKTKVGSFIWKCCAGLRE